ncbi:MAG: urease accessory protein UreE [Rhodobacteraceae bacterium]|nr:urease accessory protein UreE [Paracoccaceae bacterium]
MNGPLRAHLLHRGGAAHGAAPARIALDYEARFLRRRLLTTEAGREILVDLPETVSLEEGDALETTCGLRIGISAAAEPLIEVRGPLARLAWHVGNRHTPCEIGHDTLRIRRDHVLADMLARLGAELSEIEAPFTPERGAYGMGRTMGHAHGHDHGPEHGHDHGHSHGQAHDHNHHHHRHDSASARD